MLDTNDEYLTGPEVDRRYNRESADPPALDERP